MEHSPNRNPGRSRRLTTLTESDQSTKGSKVERLSNPPLERNQKFIERQLNGVPVTDSSRPKLTPLTKEDVKRHRSPPTETPRIKTKERTTLPQPPAVHRTGMRTTSVGEIKQYRLPPTETPRLVRIEKQLPTTTTSLKTVARSITSLPKVNPTTISTPISTLLPDYKKIDHQNIDYTLNSKPWTEKYPSYQKPLTVNNL